MIYFYSLLSAAKKSWKFNDTLFGVNSVNVISAAGSILRVLLSPYPRLFKLHLKKQTNNCYQTFKDSYVHCRPNTVFQLAKVVFDLVGLLSDVRDNFLACFLKSMFNNQYACSLFSLHFDLSCVLYYIFF